MLNTVEPSSEKPIALETSVADSVVIGVTVEGNVRTQWETTLGEYIQKLPPVVVRRKHVIDTKFEKDATCPNFRQQLQHLFVLDSLGLYPETATEIPKVVFGPTPRAKLRRKMEKYARR